MSCESRSFFNFADLPFQVFLVGGSNGNQQIQVVEVLVVGKALFEKVPASDSAINVIKVGVGVAGVLDFGTVDTQLLSDFWMMVSLG